MIRGNELRLVLDDRVVLDGVTFAIGRGESVALVGPNGSGKTSILRCLLGLVPFRGSAAIGGHDVVGEPIAARRLVGYVPQKAAFGDASAQEALTFVARVRGLDPACASALLAEVGLAAHAAERARTFSGGMQQRLALAVALLGDPPVLLLDEPSASLDAEGQERLHRLVARLREDGRTLVMASHRREEVESLTDRVLHVDRGRIVRASVAGQTRGRVVALGTRGGGR
jgi:ABC-type multidrug transport system ATPase subunit